MTYVIIGNWKMNGTMVANKALLDGLKSYQGHSKLGVCVPNIYAQQVATELAESAVTWGGQDCSAHQAGAYTGETAATMLAEFCADWCIVGHSERRTYHHESDEIIAQKANQLSAQNITPIICIGETLQQRESNAFEQVIEAQLRVILNTATQQTLQSMVIAYEPVWAIGTGKTATPEQAQQVHCMIRQICRNYNESLSHITLLYGGSMNASNAEHLLLQPDINGGLIGNASLSAPTFLAIAEIANRL